ncbi:hypothetical protein [Vibrio barjaei]|uniref:hypothetical protein n=1 Tax=Vibrio barjaei TaxID=1676683 RepID=UPI00228492EB|nr:hypothetical protein [Vibrio barjaei]MCY9874589.1 hypothetical protein [Vibrio barjaei]
MTNYNQPNAYISLAYDEKRAHAFIFLNDDKTRDTIQAHKDLFEKATELFGNHFNLSHDEITRRGTLALRHFNKQAVQDGEPANEVIEDEPEEPLPLSQYAHGLVEYQFGDTKKTINVSLETRETYQTHLLQFLFQAKALFDAKMDIEVHGGPEDADVSIEIKTFEYIDLTEGKRGMIH